MGENKNHDAFKNEFYEKSNNITLLRRINLEKGMKVSMAIEIEKTTIRTINREYLNFQVLLFNF